MASQPLKWHGGKSYLASWIIENMPPHLHYVEPYFGGGAVLFARDPNRDWMYRCYHCTDNQYRLADGLGKKQIYICNGCGTRDDLLPASDRGCSEIVNDIYGELMNFWLVLQDVKCLAEFCRRVEATPFSEELFKKAMLASGPEFRSAFTCDPIERARVFFVRYRQSRQGLGKDFATLSRNRTRRSMNEQVSSWLSAVEGLPEAHERLKRVSIMNRDALDVIKQQDGEKTHFYCDPVYRGLERTSSGEYGDFEMNDSQHEELLIILSKLTGTFQLSNYHNDMYDEAAADYGWKCIEKEIDNKAASATVKPKRIECLWSNY